MSTFKLFCIKHLRNVLKLTDTKQNNFLSTVPLHFPVVVADIPSAKSYSQSTHTCHMHGSPCRPRHPSAGWIQTRDRHQTNRRSLISAPAAAECAPLLHAGHIHQCIWVSYARDTCMCNRLCLFTRGEFFHATQKVINWWKYIQTLWKNFFDFLT